MRLTPFLFAACGDNAPIERVLGSGERLELIAYDLSDGTRTFDQSTFHDAARNEDCVITLFSSLNRYCMPTTAGGRAIFTDESCTHVLGSERSDRPPPKYFIRFYKSGELETPSRLYPPGEPTAAPLIAWELIDGYCLGHEADPTLTFYKVGPVITTDELVEIRATEHVDKGRLRISIDTSKDGWRAPGAIKDRELELPCTLAPAPNANVARCIPDDLPPVSYYSDAGCQQPLVTEERALHRDLASGCTEVVDRGEPFTGTVYEQIGESCVDVPTPTEALYQPAATTPVAELTREEAGGARIHAIELADMFPDSLLYDSTLNADCAIGDGACTPVSGAQVLTYFRDPLCAEPVDVTFVPVGTCQPPVRVAGDRLVGDVYDAPLYELTTGDRCGTYAPPPRFVVHSVSAAPITDVVTAQRE